MGRSRFLGHKNIEANASDLRVYMAEAAGVPYQVRVSIDDTTPDYLEAKVTSADDSVVVAVVNDGADEDLDLSVAVYVAAEIATHAALPNAHHNRSHSITSASDHTVTGAALDVVGLTATNTLGILTPSAAVSTVISALLKSDTNGRLRVRGLGINTAAAGDALYVGGTGTVATFGDGTGAAVAVWNGAAGQVRDIRIQSNGANRWALRVENTAEGGSDAGSDFQIFPYSDAGTIKAAAMTISRASGDVTFGTNVTVGTTLYAGTTSTTAVFGNGSGSAVVNINGAAGQVRDFRFQSGGANRWLLRANNATESGSSAGTTFEIRPYNDAGVLQSAAISITRADLGVSFGANVSIAGNATIGGDVTITTNGNQGDRFLIENSNVSGSSVFYDFNQTDRDAGSTGAFELGFYRDSNNITEVRMSKEVFEVIIRSGGTYRFPLEVRAQQVILAELPTSNPGIVGALYRSGGTVLIST